MWELAQLSQAIAIAGGAGFHGDRKGLTKWIETLTGEKVRPGGTASANLQDFIRQLEASGKVAVRGNNRR